MCSFIVVVVVVVVIVLAVCACVLLWGWGRDRGRCSSVSWGEVSWEGGRGAVWEELCKGESFKGVRTSEGNGSFERGRRRSMGVRALRIGEVYGDESCVREGSLNSDGNKRMGRGESFEW